MSDVAAHEPPILIVDDNALERFMSREALEQAGFHVVDSPDGQAGVEVFESVKPQLVLMDVKMPRMDGFAACRAIRALPGGDHTPIIMMTGLDDVESINSAYDAGATDFITKPIQSAVLVHRIRYLLRTQDMAHELRESEALLAQAQRLARLGSWQWNPGRQRVSRSKDAARIIGAPSRSDRNPLADLIELVHPDDRATVEAAYTDLLERGKASSLEYRIVSRVQGELTVHEELGVDTDADGRVTCVFGAVQDITENKRTEERIRHLAYYDSVTGLPNRALLKEQIKQALALARRHRRSTALLFLDIDQFKLINDTLGHSTGDTMLRMVAQRLADCVRDCDYLAADRPSYPAEPEFGGSAASVARLGGDEFVILLGEIRRPEDAAMVAERTIEALRQPFLLGDGEVYVTGSIGISTYPEDGDTDEILLKHADAAMYCAKDDGRNRYHFYTPSINKQALERLEMGTNLRRALKQEEFELYYQPKVNIHTGVVTGAEALLRWMSPTRGLVLPGAFISIAEETGLIVPIGEWVLTEACQQNRLWEFAGLAPLRVSVNVSAAQCRDNQLLETVERVLKRTRLPPELLELEVTESLLMRDIESSVTLLERLKALGVQISIDDFGTGYSSLSHLKRLPLDTIKIDRSFIRDIITDADGATIVEATINLGHNLRLNVLAEGVEDKAELEFLRERGCDETQGYLFSKPLPAEEFRQWLVEHPNGCTQYLSGACAPAQGACWADSPRRKVGT